MTKHGLPPLVGAIGGGRVAWQRIDSIDYDLLGYFLSCHLIIEHYLDNFLGTYPEAPFAWEEARLSFAQKVALIGKMPFVPPYDLPPAIKHLNAIRNKFAHNINASLRDEDLIPIRQFVARCCSEPDQVPTDAKDLLHHFTMIVCAYLASTIASRADRAHARAAKEDAI